MKDYKPDSNPSIIYIVRSTLEKSEIYIGKTKTNRFSSNQIISLREKIIWREYYSYVNYRANIVFSVSIII